VIKILNSPSSVVPPPYLDESRILLGEPDVVWGILWKLMQSNCAHNRLDMTNNPARSALETDILQWLWEIKVLEAYSSDFVFMAPRSILQIQVKCACPTFAIAL
jgi:hypothetical protein